MNKKKKVFLFGIDGLPPEVFHSFIKQGCLPNFEKLINNAKQIDIIPTLPATTAPGWLSIASGASPGTIGVENILLPNFNKTPDSIINGFDSRYSGVEYIWETFSNHNLDATVLKYPGSWPPRDGDFIQIDGAGGYADITCKFDVAPSKGYVAGVENISESSPEQLFPSGYKDHWRIDTEVKDIVEVFPRDAVGWTGLPEAYTTEFEFVIHIDQKGSNAKKILFGLVYRTNNTFKMLLSKSKDASNVKTYLEEGQWSNWIIEDEYLHPYAYRLKLIELDIKEKRFRLYRSEGHRLYGYTNYPELEQDLLNKVGPVVEWTGTYDYMNQLIDLETQLEIYEEHTNWMIRAIKYLTENKKWNGFFTQWHVIEYAHHLVGACLDKEHPYYNSINVERDLEFLKQVYILADKIIGEIQSVIDDDTLLVIASDHGHDLVHSIFYINNFLVNKGFLTLSENNEIIWSETKAYALFPGLIYINKVNTWKYGIVKDNEIDLICSEITNELRDVIDPNTRKHPIKVVLDRSDLKGFGHYGNRSPDLVFCMDKGYEVASRISDNSELLFEISIPYKEVTSGHGSFFPFSKSARTIALFSGPNIESDSHALPHNLVDIAPTIASYMEIPPPRNCEGRPINIFKSVK
ncbi:alkaline phosphatase family protein [Chengkuizengella axinellae]|uniref:Alkaline phosphatase family protein n=1 Tax=Chengkuizengella axinellae TaxID=3064388 RepID=A0ABT9J670_9BACL|nr:alkaline phosphatase family protein [Chengkuizengella sp. 2205SS18-9]MDP5277117.1 alkaline phosphatase family protein [Chengkuizengella sp. 2205SS18-9]